MRITILTGLFVSALAACAGTPEPVPVRGQTEVVARLAGEWRGAYSSRETGRSGSIVFELEAGRDTAYGDVVMVPRERPPDTEEGWDRMWEFGRGPGGAEVLKIRFVQVEGNRVSGLLDPYRDPECGCVLITTFEGRVRDGVIEGRYTSRQQGSTTSYGGTWRVERR